ncbi:MULTISPECIES: M48 family metalloprotease [Methylosinus]|uniref:Peptidase n=1 Tax=Methylosinus trichosporium (strain ATCC 35070 / NCIMB 11131 / UNIQEM 75 / OB3b) TaxID=595536 RepID=A0A2D2D0B7_METT3|nr:MULTISPECIES: M48 family metalloprotease [Methylosinus]ATQ68319.1 peptidase [Methylosinus trichosporium OB3b]OBS50942.1 peptidase [Methylosinus sp. 3S-1]
MRNRSRLRALLSGLLAVALAAPVRAEDGPNVSIIRDAEIEQLLRDYTKPVLEAAGIHTGAARIILVGDRSFNAFVADGQKIFVNVGALIEAKTPNEIIGVLAHESGHIAGGHLARGRQELARAAILSVAGMLASAGAIFAARGAFSRPNASVGMDSGGAVGILMGPQEAVKRSLLAYQRGEEQAADRMAVRFLTATRQSAKGMLETFNRFASETLFKSSTIDPYLQSHPLPNERISNLRQAAEQSPFFETQDPPALQARHDLMRAKLIGFTGDVGEVGRRYPVSDLSLPARYARVIADNRFGRLDEALAGADALIAAQPKNPYFWELKGQFLLEAGRAAQAIAPLRKAAGLAGPNATPIRVLLGHALVASDNPAYTDEAIKVLANATQRDEDSSEAWEFLSMAYFRKGDGAKAQLAAAEGLFVAGKYIEARTQASRAQTQFKEGSPGWLKADDILTYRPPGSE